MITRALLGSIALFGAVLATSALAHPHVWITAKAEIVYGDGGRIAGVRHAWTFDPGYSAYVTQGLETKDGKITPQALQELAKVNAESLEEFGYFTVLKTNGSKQEFEPPRDYSMSFDNGQATLTLFLPLKAPAKAAKTLALEVYDPTFFVAFSMAESEDAVRLAGAPQGCTATVTRAKSLDAGQQQQLSESFFQALSSASNYGSNFANRAIIACP